MMQSVHQRRLASSCRCSRSLIRGRRPVVTSAQASPTIETLDLPRRTFIWKGHRTNYVTAGCGQPVVLVHGFGASSGHFRRNIAVLAKEYKVYAVDLLGFGASDKPQIEYSMELWRDQVRDFMQEFVDVPAVMVGNSIGSLVSCMVTAERPDSVRGLCLLNCVGAMNNKGVLSDWRIWIVLPLLLLIDLLLKSPLAAYLFDKYRTPDNIRGILSQVYRNQESVTDDLVELLYRPSCDEGALGVFVSVMTGPPGPKPWDVIPRINKTLPVLILWGDADTFIPADGPMGKWFQALPGERPGTKFEFLADVGHCPHDDRPDEVHDKLLPWLRDMFSSDNGNGNGVQSLHRPRPCSASASASGSATQRMAHLRLSPAIGRPFALRMPACAGAALQSGSRRTARTSTRAVDATFESSAAAGVVDEAVAVVSSVLEEAKLSYNKQYDRIFGPGSHEEIDTKKALPKPDRGAQALEQGAKKVLLSDVHAIPRRPMLERQWTVTDFAYAGFLGGMHLLACLAPFTFSLPMLGLFFGMYFITGCLGITLSYHRQLSHRSFTTPKWLEYALAYCGVLAAQGDPIEWVSGHRYHHLHTDTVLDPHSPYEGFWWSHVGWLLDNDVMLARVGNRANAAELSFLWAPPWLPAIKLAYQSKPTQYLLTSSQDNDVTLARVGNRSNAADLSSQWFYRWLQATWPWHVVLQFAALFALGGLPALVWGGALRMVWVYHVTWFVNSASHCWGNQQYNTGDLSRNNWWVGLLAFGEGWHNNHHAFEFSARHGLEWWQLDVTWMIIRALQAVGLATNVKLPTERQKNRMRVRPTKAAPAAAAAAAEQQQP